MTARQPSPKPPCHDNPDPFTDDLILESAFNRRLTQDDGTFDSGVTPSLFEAALFEATESAKSLCHTQCPMLLACLRTHLPLPTLAVVGGTSLTERDAIRILLDLPVPTEPTIDILPDQAKPDQRRAVRMLLANEDTTGKKESAASIAATTRVGERTVKRFAAVIRDLKKGEPALETAQNHNCSLETADYAYRLVNGISKTIDDVSDDDLARVMAEVLSPTQTFAPPPISAQVTRTRRTVTAVA